MRYYSQQNDLIFLSMKNILILLAGVFFVGQTAFGGWVIKEESRFSDTGKKQERIVYAQDHMIRLEEKGLVTIMDLYKGIIRFYNPNTKKYWEGTIHDYDRDMAIMMKAHFMKKISDYSEEEKKKALKSYDKMIRQLQMPDSTVARHDRMQVKITQTRIGKDIAGYSTHVYMVWVNDVATEEDWIAPKIQLLPLPLLEKYYKIFDRITKYYEQGFHYQAHPTYLYMETRGYPVKVREFGYGYEVITKVTKVKRKRLSPHLFLLPGYPRRVSLQELNHN